MRKKVTIIGAGLVGSTTAYSLLMSQNLEEIALIDIDEKMVEAEVMDLQHSVPFLGYTKVKEGSYEDIKDSRVAIITCGASQKQGETRLDLIKKNSKLIDDIVSKIFNKNPNIIILMVTNPVDVLTYQANLMYPDKKDQIIGSGTILDSARFRFLLGERLSVSPQSIHAYIVGEHGDSELPLWSTATIGNVSLDKFTKISLKEKEDIFKKAKNAAYSIIEGKKATYYAISAGTTQIVETILYNKRRVLPISHNPQGSCGIKDICLSLPVVLGKKGIEKRFNMEISEEENRLLQESADNLKEVASKIE